MKVAKTIQDFLYISKSEDFKSKKVGFVPTMGALHNGHFSLIEQSKKENDITVCSIFVNPEQFNNKADFDKYPNTIEKDLAQLQNLGCDIVFLPSTDEMYRTKPTLKFDFGNLERVMEGEFRPGHFSGVALIVSKLFHIVKPQNAYFGQKDLQQFAVINRLVTDLSFDLNLVCCPTVREASGLAMSSRNLRLSADGLQKASAIYKSLLEVSEGIKTGSDATTLHKKALQNLLESGIETEYLEIVRFEDLQKPDTYSGKLAVCYAGYLEGVRLIDNLVFEIQ